MPDVPAARNALRVLRALAGRSVPVPASTLARELGIPRSSLYQLARAMMDEGFVVHYPEERAYGLSALVSEIGSGSLQTDRLRRMAHPLMERLATSSAIPLVCHRNCRDLQYRRVQRRYARILFYSRPARSVAPGRRELARRPGITPHHRHDRRSRDGTCARVRSRARYLQAC